MNLSPAEWTAILLSLKIATVATLASLPFGIFTAYALARGGNLNSGTAVHAGLIPGSFRPACNRDNEYAGPDAPPAKQPWMRIKRFQDQDICITESIGADYDRTEENLGSSDAIIGRVRATLMSAAKSLAEGREPPGRDPAEFRMRPISVQLPRDTPSWSEAIATAIETRPETFQSSV